MGLWNKLQDQNVGAKRYTMFKITEVGKKLGRCCTVYEEYKLHSPHHPWGWIYKLTPKFRKCC